MIFVSYRSGRSILAIPYSQKTVPEAVITFKRANPHVEFLECWEEPDNV